MPMTGRFQTGTISLTGGEGTTFVAATMTDSANNAIDVQFATTDQKAINFFEYGATYTISIRKSQTSETQALSREASK